jgi:LAS superfamily LD-carboxypeptidase LdcB
MKNFAVAKQADTKKDFSPTRSDNSIHRVRNEPERQLGSLRDVIGNIRRDGGTPSVESIATELGGVHATQRAPALLALQQTHGNRYVQRVVAGIQAKLAVGQPGDKYEQEADRVADEVMQMAEPHVQRRSEPKEDEEEKLQSKTITEQITPLVQRQIEPEKEEEEIIQTERAGGQTPQVNHSLEAHIQSLRSGGQHLSAPTRAFFESRFGHDFSQVRVHTDSKAVEAARSLNAKAFTIGRDVVFGTGQYSPDTLGGRQLLAHELTHVIQQQAGPLRIQRRTDDVVGCFRNNAQACLVHLHGNETTALEVARDLYCRYCVNLVYIDHPGRRKVRVDVRGHGITCCADPNRIFQDGAVRDNWDSWNNICSRECETPASRDCTDCRRRNSPCSIRCRESAIRGDAQQAVFNYRRDELEPKIRQCRGQAVSGAGVEGTGVSGPLAIIAFHGNVYTCVTTPAYRRRVGRRGESLTILSYCPGHWEGDHGATELTPVTVRVGGTTIHVRPNSDCRDTNSAHRPILNPHIETGQNPDDFILVTRSEDFVAFVGQGRNVVLQAQSPPDDGSLSVVLSSSDRYINIEAQRPRGGRPSSGCPPFRSRGQALGIQRPMGREALEYVLGGPGPSIGSCPPARTDTPCPDCAARVPSSPEASTPAPEQVQQSPQSEPEVRSQTSDTRIQRITNPSNLRTEAQRRRYSSDQFTTTAEQEWAEPTRPRFTGNQLIQRRILIGSGTDPHEMNEGERDSFIGSVRGGTLAAGIQAHRELLISQPQLTESILADMANAGADHLFANNTELVAELASRIMPLYLLGQFTPSGRDWQRVRLASGRHSHLRREVAEAFGRMQRAARGDGHLLTLVSATRTFDDQLRIWNQKMRFDRRRRRFGAFEPTSPPVSTRCASILTSTDRGLDEWDTANANHRRCWMVLTEDERALEVLKTSSAPGTSRHHWGTDIDLNSVDPQAWERSPLSGTYTWLTANAATYGFHQPYTPHSQRGGRGYFEEKWHWSYTAIAQPLLSEYRRLLFNPAEFQRGLQGRNVEAESFIVSHYQEYVGSVAQPSLLPVTRKDNRANAGNGDASQVGHRPNQTSPVTSNLETGINSMMGGGQPLSESVRAYFEPRFGQSFDHVRLHVDSHAAEYADALGARAFTLGQDVFFGAGQFTPENAPGRQLLAHELTHVIQQRRTGLQIQRHVGDHSLITSAIDKYRHTFNHAGISQSTWESGFGSANFLGVHISGGVHQELADRLANAETFLRTRYSGLSDSDIATRIGLRYIEGRRRPGFATGTSRISFHAFGLAIDVNKRENIYIAHRENEAEIIERATRLILGRPINVRMNTSGMSVVELRNTYQEASDALLTYFRLLGVRHSSAMWLQVRGRLTDEDAVERLWDQISNDREVLMRQNRGWDPLERGFIDLTEDLVVALTDSSGGGLHWLGQGRGGKDLMHFDWRSGRIRHGHRI